jgi:hypothetical protein
MRYPILVMAAGMLCGCASSADKVTASYVSPLAYQHYTCQQIGAEGERVSRRAAEAAGVQDQKATNDAVATGVALVLFWPAAFMISGDGQTAAELGRLRGEMDALEQASIQKNCGIRFAKPPPTQPPQPKPQKWEQVASG